MTQIKSDPTAASDLASGIINAGNVSGTAGDITKDNDTVLQGNQTCHNRIASEFGVAGTLESATEQFVTALHSIDQQFQATDTHIATQIAGTENQGPAYASNNTNGLPSTPQQSQDGLPGLKNINGNY